MNFYASWDARNVAEWKLSKAFFLIFSLLVVWLVSWHVKLLLVVHSFVIILFQTFLSNTNKFKWFEMSIWDPNRYYDFISEWTWNNYNEEVTQHSSEHYMNMNLTMKCNLVLYAGQTFFCSNRKRQYYFSRSY